MVIARMEQYLNENDSMKVDVGELELLLGPEDSEVDLRHIFLEVCEEEEGSQDLLKFSARRVRVSSC